MISSGISDAEDSIPDVSEIDLNDQMTDDEGPVMLLDDDTQEQVVDRDRGDTDNQYQAADRSEQTNKENTPESLEKGDTDDKLNSDKTSHHLKRVKDRQIPGKGQRFSNFCKHIKLLSYATIWFQAVIRC